ncbi:flap endonuclease Xni [Shewanella sp. JM162201]|uniref:Flap endonuclease Xni n=1 Tax=Shewanella jiangmenensis TaxID=2837387 RepID=A0ABS5UYN4_9GAMM|nr:flap endonuclease Xni [Shewanella jiangmenensis]MBT1443238.1 flap endonuclease Xni [Shewanella jiangmenensis]
MNLLLIIDGLNLIRRIHAALPDEADMAALEERSVLACRKLLRGHSPSHCAIVWDGDAISWRKQLYEDYKKGRKPMPDALAQGLPALREKLTPLGVNSVFAESEADDVIATLATKLVSHGGEAIIVSTDKGLLQLQSPKIRQWDHFAGQFMDIEAFENKLGIERHQYLDYLALCGDSGNKIPGVPGIGPKSAGELLRTYRSIANLYHSLGTLGPRQAQKLRDGRELARMSYRLARLQTDLPLSLKLSDLRTLSNLTG